jgi:hypothetical protein
MVAGMVSAGGLTAVVAKWRVRKKAGKKKSEVNSKEEA